MNSKSFSILTIVTTALSAIALFMLPYSAGVFPGGMFEDAAVGPLPLWTICLALSLLQLVIAAGTLLKWRGHSNKL
jgi:membrane protein DedA with SNARE-associated domain